MARAEVQCRILLRCNVLCIYANPCSFFNCGQSWRRSLDVKGKSAHPTFHPACSPICRPGVTDVKADIIGDVTVRSDMKRRHDRYGLPLGPQSHHNTSSRPCNGSIIDNSAAKPGWPRREKVTPGRCQTLTTRLRLCVYIDHADADGSHVHFACAGPVHG